MAIVFTDPPPVGLVVEVGEHEDGLGDAAHFAERPSQGARASTAVKGPQQLRRPHRALEQRAGEPQQVRPSAPR
jgi:hypothetical protein